MTVRADAPRRKRRLAFAGGVAVAVAAVVSTAMLLQPEPAPEPTFVQPATATVLPPRPPFKVKAVGGRLGEVVRTGLPASDGREWVINFAPNEFSGNPDITVQLSIGERDARGTIIEALAISDPKGSDHSPGFHYTQAPMRT